MSDFKRSVSTIAAMEAASSGASMSKKRRTSGGGSELYSAGERLRSSHLRDLMMTTASPASSLNSAGTVVSGVFPDRVLNCCSGIVKTTTGVAASTTATTPVPSLDLEAKGFDTVDSTPADFKAFRRDRCLLSEFSGDSEETMVSPAGATKERNIPAANMPSKEEIEEFFAVAEKYEQKRFTEKYNYDIGKDMPLEGRYQWVRLN